MDDLYRELILDHYKNPRNFGHLQSPTHSFEKNNPFCGDTIRMEVVIRDDKIIDIAFSGEGCAISMAAASLLTERTIGMSITCLQATTKDDIFKLLGNLTLTPTRIKCALLALEVVQKAFTDKNSI